MQGKNISIYMTTQDNKTLEELKKEYFKQYKINFDSNTKLFRYSLYLLDKHFQGIESADSERLQFMDFTDIKQPTDLDKVVSDIFTQE